MPMRICCLFFDFFYNYNALSRFLITKLEYTDNLFLTYVLGIKFTGKEEEWEFDGAQAGVNEHSEGDTAFIPLPRRRVTCLGGRPASQNCGAEFGLTYSGRRGRTSFAQQVGTPSHGSRRGFPYLNSEEECELGNRARGGGLGCREGRKIDTFPIRLCLLLN